MSMPAWIIRTFAGRKFILCGGAVILSFVMWYILPTSAETAKAIILTSIVTFCGSDAALTMTGIIKNKTDGQE